MDRVLAAIETTEPKADNPPPSQQLTLGSHEGVAPHPVLPPPVFHGRRVPVFEGFVDVGDIRLSSENERLKIHVGQFQRTHGRSPDSDDLVKIMSSQANLPGLGDRDQFKILSLAKSIAAGGVRQPPIVSHTGVLLDGNRRVAACLHVLGSDDFKTDEKARTKRIRVWQLTEHATSSDEEAVVVALNFEPDQKVDWPAYVKGRILYEEWRGMLENEGRASVARQRELKRALARRFAISVDRVNRYIAMVSLAEEFEEHHSDSRERNHHEIQHRTNEYFEYFDELGKGRGPGGVNWTLNEDESFKALVFDLLYDGKFPRFSAIRALNHIHRDEEAMEVLVAAKECLDIEEARNKVDMAISTAKVNRPELRRLGANKRVETFVKWLLDVPVGIFRVGEPGALKETNVRGLYGALKLVEAHVPKGWRLTKGRSS